MTRISAFTSGFSGHTTVSRSFVVVGGDGQDPNEYNGSTMLFLQATAPTGWTKVTTYDDYALRVTSGTVSTGGSVNFSSVFSTITPTGTVTGVSIVGTTTGATTIDTTTLASHTHPVGSWAPGTGTPGTTAAKALMDRSTGTSSPTAAGGSHSHPVTSGSVSCSFSANSFDMRIRYIDTIMATK
jgi:hypothetical protein